MRAFQTRVASVLREIYPEKKIVIAGDPQAIEFEGALCGITNIRATFLLSDETEETLREIVENQFGILVANRELVDDREHLDWETASSQIMPQLMPVEFLDRLPVVNQPFGDQIVLAFVLDSDKSYSYVNADDLNRWKISESELHTTAIKNLDDRSKGIEVTEVPGPNGLVVINTLDSFDAVRIVSPKIQKFVSEILGSSFYFGVPNRDFLICWTKNEDEEFQKSLRGQISQDFDERPYPLSRFTFEFNNEGAIIQCSSSAPGPGAARASLN